MNENEFNLDFDFEKEYGFYLPQEDPAPEEDDFDLDALLAEDYGETAPEYEGEYAADFDYGPELDLDVDVDVDALTADYLNEDQETITAPEPDEPQPESIPETPEEVPAPPAPGKRRKPVSPLRKFKNETLPLIILGVSALLILIFIIGATGRAITAARNHSDAAKDASESQLSEAQRQENAANALLDEAALLAAGYDYQGAIDLLDTFDGDLNKFTQISLRKSEYEMAKSQLVAHADPNEVVNLSFHVLIADPSRAFSNSQYGNKYNQNFVTIDEFEAILEDLYENNYVLVSMDDFISETTNGDTTTYESKTLYLPEGKKPLMLTETMVNYFLYMVDSDNDWEPDKGGAGFASRLVVDSNGDIKAEMVDANGNTVVGNYDLVPILDDFIKAHPDFSYQGARATLAITGHNGIFGYRTQASAKENKSLDYYEKQIAGAKTIVEALRADGYEIACYTYANKNYGTINADEIQKDLDNWNAEVTPLVGKVDTLVYAQSSDISTTGNYTGSRYNVLSNQGFRYYITSGSKPATTVAGDYVRQVRLMVTGAQMAHAASTYSSYFDAKSVLNSLRGDVPQA